MSNDRNRNITPSNLKQLPLETYMIPITKKEVSLKDETKEKKEKEKKETSTFQDFQNMTSKQQADFMVIHLLVQELDLNPRILLVTKAPIPKLKKGIFPVVVGSSILPSP